MLVVVYYYHFSEAGVLGGCTVSIVKNDSIDDFKENVGREYTKKTGIEAEFYIVSVGDGPVEL